MKNANRLSIVVALGFALSQMACNSGLREFPLPAPPASAEQLLPDSVFAPDTKVRTLGDLNRVISNALDTAGYGDRSYLWVPDGFVVVTRMEQIYADGRPKDPRFATKPVPMRSFSLVDLARALFTADPGYYRVIVFVVTPHPVSQAGRQPTQEEMEAYLRSGASALPSQLAARPRLPGTSCTVLIYEFENKKTDRNTPANWIPGDLSGKDHLVGAGVWAALHLQSDAHAGTGF